MQSLHLDILVFLIKLGPVFFRQYLGDESDCDICFVVHTTLCERCRSVRCGRGVLQEHLTNRCQVGTFCKSHHFCHLFQIYKEVVLVNARLSKAVSICERMVFRHGQYSSLCGGAAVDSLDAVDIGEEVLVRVQAECTNRFVKHHYDNEARTPDSAEHNNKRVPFYKLFH